MITNQMIKINPQSTNKYEHNLLSQRIFKSDGLNSDAIPVNLKLQLKNEISFIKKFIIMWMLIIIFVTSIFTVLFFHIFEYYGFYISHDFLSFILISCVSPGLFVSIIMDVSDYFKAQLISIFINVIYYLLIFMLVKKVKRLLD